MPSFRPDLRSWEPSDSTYDAQAEPVRTIGIFAVGDAPQAKVPRHAFDEDEPETPKKRPNRHRVPYQALEDSMVDELDPIDDEEFDEPVEAPRARRAPAKVRTAPASPRAATQKQSSRQSGLVIVLALVAASVAITGSLLWGLHHHSAPAVGVTSLDNARPAPSFDDPSRGAYGRSRSGRYPDSADSADKDLDSSSASDPDLDAPEKPDDPKYDPNADPDLGSAKDSLKDPSDSSDPTSRSGSRSGGIDDGTGRYSPDLDGSGGSAPSNGPRTRPQPRAYPDYSRDPGYSRGPSRSGPGLPSLGGL